MKILFQGDSITDAGRNRESDKDFGMGYPILVKAELGFEEPTKYKFMNRGISGNRIVDLYARIKPDIINLAPDVMSILVGVNDVWHELAESPNGVDADKFFKVYSMLIEDVKEALPDIKIIILEPFFLKVDSDIDWSYFEREVPLRAEMAKKVAEKYNLPFIPLQAGFNELLKKNSNPRYWLRDGVHPTPMGHQFIKNQWIKAFKEL